MSEPTILRDADVLTITSGESILGEYHALSDVQPVDTPKPYLHPLRTRGGIVVTGFGPDDHPWHHGLQFAFPRVGDHNLWGGGTYLGPDEGYRVIDDQGSIRHDAWTDVSDSGFTHALTWLGHDGEELLTEVREVRVAISEDGAGWSLEIVSTLTNATGAPIALATPAQRGRPDGGYGGLFLRLAQDVQADALLGANGAIEASGAESRTLVIHAHDAAGSPFTLGLSFLDDASPGAQKWLYRFAPEPFSAVGWAGAYDDGFELPVGGSLRFGHRLAILDGTVDPERVTRLL